MGISPKQHKFWV